MTAGEMLAELRERLKEHSDSPGLDAQTLLTRLLGRSRAWLIAHTEADISPEEETQVWTAAARLERGEPLPYVLGSWEFYGREFHLNRHTLIPRPETELLVEHAVRFLRDRSAPQSAADIGTGSGCIAVSIAVEVPKVLFLATDISLDALRVARKNVGKYRLEDRILIVQSDLISPLGSPVDLLCANMPYIPTDVLPALRVSRSEPVHALDGGPEGLAIIRRLLWQAENRMAPGGLLLLEIEASQGESVQGIAKSVFPSAIINVLQDLSGRDRLLKIQLLAD